MANLLLFKQVRVGAAFGSLFDEHVGNVVFYHAFDD